MYNMVVYKSSVYDSNAERYQRKDEMRRIKNEIHANRKEKLDGKYKSKREEKKTGIKMDHKHGNFRRPPGIIHELPQHALCICIFH